jgi:hypothetical protein
VDEEAGGFVYDDYIFGFEEDFYIVILFHCFIVTTLALALSLTRERGHDGTDDVVLFEEVAGFYGLAVYRDLAGFDGFLNSSAREAGHVGNAEDVQALAGGIVTSN